MKRKIRGRFWAGILAAVVMCTAVPETAYAVNPAEVVVNDGEVLSNDTLDSVSTYSMAYDTDNYPTEYKNMDYWYCYNNIVPDKWSFVVRQCTSFVAFRLNEVNGVPFTNWYGGVQWGNATTWGSVARGLGIPLCRRFGTENTRLSRKRITARQ